MPPDGRRHAELARTIKTRRKSFADHLFNSVGKHRRRFNLIILRSSLDVSSPGDKLLLANYGDGADALILTV